MKKCRIKTDCSLYAYLLKKGIYVEKPCFVSSLLGYTVLKIELGVM